MIIKIIKNNKKITCPLISMFLLLLYFVLYKFFWSNMLINYAIDTLVFTSIISILIYGIFNKNNMKFSEIFSVIYIDLLLNLIVFPECSIRLIEVAALSLIMFIPLIVNPLLFIGVYFMLKRIYIYFKGRMIFNKIYVVFVIVIILNIINVIKSVLLYHAY